MKIINPSPYSNMDFSFLSVNYEIPVFIDKWYGGIYEYISDGVLELKKYEKILWTGITSLSESSLIMGYTQLLKQYPSMRKIITDTHLILEICGVTIDLPSIVKKLESDDKKLHPKRSYERIDWIPILEKASFLEGLKSFDSELLEEILIQNNLYGHIELLKTYNLTEIYRSKNDKIVWDTFLEYRKTYDEKLSRMLAILSWHKLDDPMKEYKCPEKNKKYRKLPKMTPLKDKDFFPLARTRLEKMGVSNHDIELLFSKIKNTQDIEKRLVIKRKLLYESKLQEIIKLNRL